MMLSSKRINGYNAVIEEFNDIYSFFDAINTRPNVNRIGTSSHKISEGWSGTKTWEEAEGQLKTGLEEVCKNLKRDVMHFATTHEGLPRRMYQYAAAGYKPHIGRALAGHPKAMIKCVKVPVKIKLVDIAYNCTQNSDITASELYNSGKVVLQLVQLLELNGARVRLRVLPKCSRHYSNELSICSVKLKDFNASLDILKVSFPLVSPAMFRRFGFAWLETCPAITRDIGYGSSFTKHEECESYLLKTGAFNGATIITYPLIKTVNFDVYKLAEALKLT